MAISCAKHVSVTNVCEGSGVFFHIPMVTGIQVSMLYVGVMRCQVFKSELLRNPSSSRKENEKQIEAGGSVSIVSPLR